MKSYNEIYPAEGWADKILKYLQKVALEKPNMYAKTKRRYEALAYSLLDSASLIASILEEDSLVPSSNDEFDELSSTDDRIHKKLAEVNQRFRKTEEFSTSKFSTSDLDKHSESDGSDESSDYSYYDICKYYDVVLKGASVLNFGYSEVNECAKLLYLWFHTRFMPEIQDPDFTCQLRYLPIWITSFIIVYGKYFQQGKIAKFKEIVDRWCEKVQQGKGGIYAIPFQVYKIEKDFKDGVCQPSDYTIEAVIINDLLANGCLYRLGDNEYDGAVRYNSNDLVNVVRDRNPALFTKIRNRVVKRQELIREIGLTPVGDIDTNE